MTHEEYNETERGKAFALAFIGYGRSADSFDSDREWAIWQHDKLTRIFELLQVEYLTLEARTPH